MDDKKEKYLEYVRSKLDLRTLLEQLAEESAEFTQAILKVIRAAGLSDNPTPVSAAEAAMSFVEEYRDMALCLHVLNITDESAEDISIEKLKRWAERLGYKEDE